jgi:adenylate cyclase
VTAEAKAGQILIGKETLRWLPNAIAARTRFIGSTEIKGEQEPFELFELIWDNDNHNVTLGQDTLESKRGHTRARVWFREATFDVGFDRPAIRMGRGRENEIVVPEPLASRVHAKIEWRRDHVFLIDQSLNGTYLQVQGKPEVILRRDEIALEGTGVISLGKSTAVQDESCVRFAVLKAG